MKNSGILETGCSGKCIRGYQNRDKPWVRTWWLRAQSLSQQNSMCFSYCMLPHFYLVQVFPPLTFSKWAGRTEVFWNHQDHEKTSQNRWCFFQQTLQTESSFWNQYQQQILEASRRSQAILIGRLRSYTSYSERQAYANARRQDVSSVRQSEVLCVFCNLQGWDPQMEIFTHVVAFPYDLRSEHCLGSVNFFQWSCQGFWAVWLQIWQGPLKQRALC